MQLLQSADHGARVNTSTLLNSLSPAQPAEDVVPAPQYAIAANATLQERRTRTLKHGDTFAVFDQRGEIGGEPGNSEGLYYRDTRILSQFQLLLEEARPLLLSSMTQDDNAVFSADLSNPDLLIDGRIAFRREQQPNAGFWQFGNGCSQHGRSAYAMTFSSCTDTLNSWIAS